MFQDFFLYGFVGKYVSAEHISQTTTIVSISISVAVIAILSYLLGSLNFAIIISGKQYRQDIRSFGSKNAGMTNMMRTYGKKAAGLTLLGDALKAVVSCLLGYALIGQYGAYIAGVFCILGHMFPVYYRFRGGKGVVTAAITILMCNPIVFLILFVIFVIIVLCTKFISLGSVVCIMLYPIVLDRIERSTLFHDNPPAGCPYVIFAILIMLLVVYKHKDNIKRLFHGEESKFSFKKSVKAPSEKEEQSPAKKEETHK
ncbi:MAG: glycerol-3-phosphate 1-O-acyltransferase PlsY [Clostridia bacterium]|nr:glycerol-3-phosphate 1-O-acyltransferase PlsY [Clostridia bacterium]